MGGVRKVVCGLRVGGRDISGSTQREVKKL